MKHEQKREKCGQRETVKHIKGLKFEEFEKKQKSNKDRVRIFVFDDIESFLNLFPQYQQKMLK